MSAAFPRLSELQALFWQLITAPEGVEAGAAELRRSGALSSTDLAFLVRGDARLGPSGRLDVYADMYFYRLRDCLAEDYPKLVEWVGPTRFHNLVTDYLLAHPSTHYSLRELGRALPGFLESHVLAAEFGGCADLARLEWARVDVFDEGDAELLGREVLLARGAGEAEFRFGLVPAVRRLGLGGEALARWRDPAGAGRPAAPAAELLVWRRDFGVYHRSLAADEAACLDLLATAPRSVAELGEAVVAALPPDAAPERAGERLAALLETWTRDGLLTATG